eukprot:CAMPEP_0119362628 /NCGR_PEP_ID=MMETSP1334-20130426/9635_1 /TAXON_ID=127549 /ORGANISM="Calcidiscus leptoporus, Strain RCC1130" /LENGTH=113 /DNA_ID=CAMNT_0007377859 /DNA_START=196 /DNA_END=533 /DNA_ORIENTATION=+
MQVGKAPPTSTPRPKRSKSIVGVVITGPSPCLLTNHFDRASTEMNAPSRSTPGARSSEIKVQCCAKYEPASPMPAPSHRSDTYSPPLTHRLMRNSYRRASAEQHFGVAYCLHA